MSDKTEGLRSVSGQDVQRAVEDEQILSPIEDIIEDARNGKMFILIDDEDRENEGDLIVRQRAAASLHLREAVSTEIHLRHACSCRKRSRAESARPVDCDLPMPRLCLSRNIEDGSRRAGLLAAVRPRPRAPRACGAATAPPPFVGHRLPDRCGGAG